MNYHDPSVALVASGEVVFAAEEERFTRIKSSPGKFPIRALKHALAEYIRSDEYEIVIPFCPRERQRRNGTELRSELTRTGLYELIAGGESGVGPFQKLSSILNTSARVLLEYEQTYNMWARPAAIKALIMQELQDLRPPADIYFIEHHLAHAAGAFLQSPFEQAVAVIVDGVGELASTSVWDCDGETFRCLSKKDFPDSLGYFYAAVTAFLGFTPWRDEGKTMALAPYGRATEMAKILCQRFELQRSFDFSKFIENCTGSGLSLAVETAKAEVGKLFDVVPRAQGQEISQVYKDIAAAAQWVLEKELLSTVDYAMRQARRANVCVSGGVFFNCKANGNIRNGSGASGMFVQPVCGDAGTSLGAALYRSWSEHGHRSAPVKTLALGRAPNRLCLHRELSAWKVKYDALSGQMPQLAEELAAGRIILWFNGRSEFGPRALGQRSILADPRSSEIADRLNKEIKQRESWRPFGPMIAMEYATEILEGVDLRTPPLFMVEAYRVRDKWVRRIPGVIHPGDQSTRPQLVDKSNHALLHELIRCFRSITGVPVLLNTSLNFRNQPLIDDLEDALKMLYSSSADILVADDLVIRK